MLYRGDRRHTERGPLRGLLITGAWQWVGGGLLTAVLALTWHPLAVVIVVVDIIGLVDGWERSKRK